ncbi:uncharacterized protein LOC144180159 [Haemaphysalis longicornis]
MCIRYVALLKRKSVTNCSTEKKNADNLRGTKVTVKWADDKEPAPAILVESGKQSTLEKKRAKLVEDAGLLDFQGANGRRPQLDDECTSCSLNAAELAELRAKIANLEEENAVLRRQLEAVDNYRESYRMLKKASKLAKKLEDEPARVAATPMVDLGHGVLASEVVVKALRNSCAGNATKFARALLKNLFTKEELKGKSLFGKQCNARKDLLPKTALDSARVQAVIGLDSKGACPDPVILSNLCCAKGLTAAVVSCFAAAED